MWWLLVYQWNSNSFSLKHWRRKKSWCSKGSPVMGCVYPKGGNMKRELIKSFAKSATVGQYELVKSSAKSLWLRHHDWSVKVMTSAFHITHKLLSLANCNRESYWEEDGRNSDSSPTKIYGSDKYTRDNLAQL